LRSVGGVPVTGVSTGVGVVRGVVAAAGAVVAGRAVAVAGVVAAAGAVVAGRAVAVATLSACRRPSPCSWAVGGRLDFLGEFRRETMRG
jgi:hypothetical protein